MTSEAAQTLQALSAQAKRRKTDAEVRALLPATVAHIASTTGKHPNTVRASLRRLGASLRVERDGGRYAAHVWSMD